MMRAEQGRTEAMVDYLDSEQGQHDIEVARETAHTEEESASAKLWQAFAAHKRACAKLWQAFAAYQEWQQDQGDPATFASWAREELPDLMPKMGA